MGGLLIALDDNEMTYVEGTASPRERPKGMWIKIVAKLVSSDLAQCTDFRAKWKR